MNQHVDAWLAAYHDGELEGYRLRQVEAHLAVCETCRAELEGLRRLSALLHESPAAGGLLPPDRFAAQVGLRLPPRPEQTFEQRALGTAWRLLPVGLFGTWVFLQAVFIVTAVLLAGLSLAGGHTADLLPGSGGGFWPGGLPGLVRLGDFGLVAWRMLSGESLLTWRLPLSMTPQLVIALMYCSWLASWWVRHRQNGQPAGNHRAS
jgi:hypothetical protein